MSGRERILVAMSGGVDSSVAAARLLETGADVVGVTLHLWDSPEDRRASGSSGKSHGRCCAPEDTYDARRVADSLGFAHFTFDRRELFAATIVEPFVQAYLAGETPSPCSACNRGVKLAELFALAERFDATHVATGHYARVVHETDGSPRIAMGADRSKDQSYFLYACPRSWIERLSFPLGESTKAQVRAEAVARRLPGAGKGESQELCFVGDEGYADFVAARAGDRVRPGAIVDEQGREVGAHAGVHRFTVGQRRGLGVSLGKAAFVARVDAETGTVHVGSQESLWSRGAALTDVVLSEGVLLPTRARVRVRYKHEGEAAVVAATDDGARVAFDAPVRAVTPGQIAVFYDRDRVVGGGRVAHALASMS